LGAGGSSVTLLDSQTFSSSTTYTVPSGALFAIVEGRGGGGGGGGGAREAGTPWGGLGGSGAPKRKETIVVTPNESITVVIGAGGLGGLGKTVSGTFPNASAAGGTSRFGQLYFVGGLGNGGNNTIAVGHTLEGIWVSAREQTAGSGGGVRRTWKKIDCIWRWRIWGWNWNWWCRWWSV
jgi:hypothetical protein